MGTFKSPKISRSWYTYRETQTVFTREHPALAMKLGSLVHRKRPVYPRRIFRVSVFARDSNATGEEKRNDRFPGGKEPYLPRITSPERIRFTISFAGITVHGEATIRLF